MRSEGVAGERERELLTFVVSSTHVRGKVCNAATTVFGAPLRALHPRSCGPRGPRGGMEVLAHPCARVPVRAGGCKPANGPST